MDLEQMTSKFFTVSVQFLSTSLWKAADYFREYHKEALIPPTSMEGPQWS